MTPEQLEELISNALVDIGEYISASDTPAYKQAYADLYAMRQPITADALLADGWTKRSPNTDYWWSKSGVSITNDKGSGGNGRWSFYTRDDRSRVTRAHPDNMYDLRELIRLLGENE